LILIIVNYLVKILTILIGLVFVTGIFLPKSMQAEPMFKFLGAVLIAWGIYRTILYRTQLKRYKRNNED